MKMRLKRIASALCIVAVLASTSMAESWSVDPVHSIVEFSVRHMVISKVKGRFDEFEGTVDFDGKSPAGGSVELTVQIASINTDDSDRDAHLKGPDFFDAENNPTMVFKSKEVVMVEGKTGEFKLIGDLTLSGITKEVVFDCEFNGVANDPWGNTKSGFSASTVINRQDFGLKWSKTLETGGLLVGNDVTIVLELELLKAAG